VAVQRLDRGVVIQNPGLRQQRPHRVVEMTLQPRRSSRLLDLVQAPAHRVLTHNLAHPQQRRVHRVTAQRRDVGIAPLTRQDRQHRRAEHITLRGRVGAGVKKRAIRNNSIVPAAHLQVLGKERQVTKRRHRRVRVPFHMHRTGIGVHRHACAGDRPLNVRSITRRVPLLRLRYFQHLQSLQPFSSILTSHNCRIWDYRWSGPARRT
jgi:hypothetical protein